MRLLIFTTQFPPAVGGVETMTWQLGKEFLRQGVGVTILAPEIPGATEFDAGEKLRIKRFALSDPDTIIAKGRQKVALVKTLRQSVEEAQADCILCTSWDPCACIANIARVRSLRIPYFLIAHGMELMQLPRGLAARKTKALIRRRALRGARRVFAVSNFTRERVVALGVPQERVSVVPNGVQALEVPPNGHRNGRGRVLMTVSRLVPRKGHDTVLRAMPRLLEIIPDATYRIVGAGPELQTLQKLSRQLGLDPHVEFCGEVSDAERERLLSECDVFVFASRQTATDFEGFGIAVLEAMQKGKAVVVTRAGGVPEIVANGRTGIVVEPDDSAALADAIIELLQHPERAGTLGSNAQRVVNEQYRWDVIAARYLAEMKAGLAAG